MRNRPAIATQFASHVLNSKQKKAVTETDIWAASHSPRAVGRVVNTMERRREKGGEEEGKREREREREMI